MSDKENNKGDKTHHHDQLMKPVSFNPMNKIVNNPTNPTPPLD